MSEQKIWLGGLDYQTVQDLIDTIKEKGYSEKDYKDLRFNLTWDGVYYEGDHPNYELEYIKKS